MGLVFWKMSGSTAKDAVFTCHAALKESRILIKFISLGISEFNNFGKKMLIQNVNFSYMWTVELEPNFIWKNDKIKTQSETWESHRGGTSQKFSIWFSVASEVYLSGIFCWNFQICQKFTQLFPMILWCPNPNL